jgi:type VI secretion system protein ImpB
MAKESTQKKVGRVRPPRVQIEYEVYVGDAMQLKELPFVVGVLGDFSGKPEQPLPPLAQRKFVEIDRDNFDKVLAGCKPRLAYRVDDKLSGQAGNQLAVELKFESLDDFEPANVVRQVKPMADLLETRNKLKDLLAKLDGNDAGSEALRKIMENAEMRDEIARQLGVTKTPEGGN